MTIGYGAVLGVIVGAVLSLSSQIFMEAYRESRRREQLSHAIAGEIAAILEIVEGRKYVETIHRYIDLTSKGESWILKIQISANYFVVTEANLQNIGSLPVELPLLIPRFLILAKSAIEDLSALNEGKFDALCRISSVGDHPVSLVEDHLIS